MERRRKEETMLRTLVKTTWDKVKVGEVFAINACWAILYKTSKDTARLLDVCSEDKNGENPYWSYCKRYLVGKLLKRTMKYFKVSFLIDFEEYYKLPEYIQKLWKEE